MTDVQRKLGYDDKQALLKAIESQINGPRSRITLILSGGSEYVFSYVNTVEGVFYGISALNGRQVSIDPDNLTLTEH